MRACSDVDWEDGLYRGGCGRGDRQLGQFSPGELP